MQLREMLGRATQKHVVAMAMVPLLAAAVLGQSYRYDVLTVEERVVPFPDYTMITRNACDCRKRCIPDNACLAYSVLPTLKDETLCYFSTAVGVQYRLLVNISSITYFKERKPKLYFWSQASSNDPTSSADFERICSAEHGYPGIILTQQDYNYINLYLNLQITGGDKRPIPLYMGRWHNTTLGIGWNALLSLFTNHGGNQNDDCKYLKKDSPNILLWRDGCNNNKPILCYKYDP